MCRISDDIQPVKTELSRSDLPCRFMWIRESRGLMAVGIGITLEVRISYLALTQARAIDAPCR
jgi:hypothetical protein